jgi:hypothetical protein
MAYTWAFSRAIVSFSCLANGLMVNRSSHPFREKLSSGQPDSVHAEYYIIPRGRNAKKNRTMDDRNSAAFP